MENCTLGCSSKLAASEVIEIRDRRHFKIHVTRLFKITVLYTGNRHLERYLRLNLVFIRHEYDIALIVEKITRRCFIAFFTKPLDQMLFRFHVKRIGCCFIKDLDRIASVTRQVTGGLIILFGTSLKAQTVINLNTKPLS